MAMLDGLRVVFLEALSFVDEGSRYELVKQWNEQCDQVYEYKNSLIREEHYKAISNLKTIQDMNERLISLLKETKTETAREIFAGIEDLFFDKYLLGNITASLFEDKYAELKEKYCGKDTNVPTKKTNFDRIKEMTVDEMAKFIPAWSYTGGCKCSGKSYVDCNDDCENCVKEWLESEVNENG